ncbi:hypothetical protein LWI29_010887 [Acer saccharum]|uniref:BZIP domain-containing protein n=1 Tax=Acer saccharum TaxID=4024 RepID=A0AA39SBZ3_ACESA|nr:hypothetical protein LWI29_010887 [Acer saccharum]KAK1564878.1 hypothetical protein Q3G72_013747 [Acer saccharum]
MEGTGGKKTISGLPPKPFLTTSNTTFRGNAPTGVTDPTIALQQVVVHGNQDPIDIDDKKLRRALASVQHSRTYRLKQREYVAQLVKEVKAFKAENEIMALRMKYVDDHNTLLRTEKRSLEQKLSACMGEKNIKEAKYEELKQEKDELKQLYGYLQQMQLDH